jgi:hypothetical protein
MNLIMISALLMAAVVGRPLSVVSTHYNAQPEIETLKILATDDRRLTTNDQFALAERPEEQIMCTQIGCMDGLTLTTPIQYAGQNIWKPGHYRFDFVINGQKEHCTGVLPLKPCDYPSLTCTSSAIMITESGCALPAEAQGFGDISLPVDTETLSLTITRDGHIISEGSWKPAYKISQPNGPQCEPICKQASYPLEFRS